MRSFGVACRTAAGEDVIVAVQAESADEARTHVQHHQALWFGGGDGAGRWLASRNPDTIVYVGAEVVEL